MNSTQQQTFFSNPVCKQTYHSLPKIYGGSKSYRSPTRTKKSIIIREFKQCCTSVHEKTPTDVELPRPTRHFSLIKSRILSQPKGQKCTKSNCMCSLLHDQQPKAKRQTTKTIMQRKPKPKLKTLRFSKPDDFQSQHKVAMRISTEPNMPSGLNSLLGLDKLRQARNKIEQNNKSKSYLQTSFKKREDNSKNKRRTEGISKGIQKISGINQEAEGCLPRSLTQEILALRARKSAFENSAFLITERDASSYISKMSQKQVASVQVQVNLYEKQQQKETGIATQTIDNYSPSIREKTNLSRNRKLVKERQNRYEQDGSGSEQSNDEKKSQKSSLTKSRQSNSSLSLSSCLIKGLGNKSTEFQRLDLKQNSSKLNNSRAKSTNEDGSFKVPKKGEYASFLKSYKILDKKSFNLKELVKKSLFTIVEEEQGVFFGEYKDDHKNGSGIQVSGKQIFQGVFDKNVKIKGSERNIDGVYKGYFEQGKREGYGTFQWNNGEKFEGNWKKGVKQGFGIWRSPKGDYYEGEWHNNRQQGEGIFRHKNSTYQGQFMNFLKHGQGEERFANGDIYIGEYKEGKPDGEGKYIWEDQSSYQGEFKNGLRNGVGKWIEVNGNIYQGQFEQDFRHGQGKLLFQTGEIFEGIFMKGVEHKGKFYNNLGEVEEIDNSQSK